MVDFYQNLGLVTITAENKLFIHLPPSGTTEKEELAPVRWPQSHFNQKPHSSFSQYKGIFSFSSLLLSP